MNKEKRTEMDNDVKLSKYWDGNRLRNTITLMEQFWMLMNDKGLDDTHRKCAKRLFEHERRLAMCLVMKDFPEDFTTDRFINSMYIDDMFKGYGENA